MHACTWGGSSGQASGQDLLVSRGQLQISPTCDQLDGPRQLVDVVPVPEMRREINRVRPSLASNCLNTLGPLHQLFAVLSRQPCSRQSRATTTNSSKENSRTSLDSTRLKAWL